MKLAGILIGIFIAEAIISIYNYYCEEHKIEWGISVLLVTICIVGGIMLSGLVSLMAPALAPTTDYDYSFNIYSLSNNSETFMMDESGGYYTYMRKMADGTRSESIPTDISYIVYSDDAKPNIQVDAVKYYDTGKWKKTGFFFWEPEWEPTISVNKYIITLPTDAIVR